MGIVRLVLLVISLAPFAFAQSTVLYQTSFEQSEGYNKAFNLSGQNGWTSEGTGGNGLVNEFFDGMGQQAYIGFTPPSDLGEFTSVWKPLNIPTLPAGKKMIRFSVTMQIVPSTGGGDDYFRWSVYSTNATRLFSIEFDPSTQKIWLITQSGQVKDTGWTFDFEGVYDLNIWFNFEKNIWSAFLETRMIVNSEKIAELPQDINVGDVDAVWVIRNTSGVGNNYMLFDDYRLTSETATSIPAVLDPQGRNAAGHFTFDVYGEKGRNYSIEVTTSLRADDWFSLGTFSNPTGVIPFEDTTSALYSLGFYRARQVP